jgi:hypothetical protein
MTGTLIAVAATVQVGLGKPNHHMQQQCNTVANWHPVCGTQTNKLLLRHPRPAWTSDVKQSPLPNNLSCERLAKYA